VFALRLASLLHRNRTEVAVPPMGVREDDAGFTLAVPREWLDENPLSAFVLHAETQAWSAVGLRFALVPLTERAQSQFAPVSATMD
jgi:exopolyphosphatase/guanosine-5'-triphosphate,3'-diphosphate pyrophosphatase